MPKYRLTCIDMELVYTIRTPGGEPFLIPFQLPQVNDYQVTSPEEIAAAEGDAILGLRALGSVQNPQYRLYRLKDAAELQPPLGNAKPKNLTLALNIELTAPNGKKRLIPLPYKILPQDENVPAKAEWPSITKWKFLLKRSSTDPLRYTLFHSVFDADPAGDFCSDKGCFTTTDNGVIQDCSVNGCYKVSFG